MSVLLEQLERPAPIVLAPTGMIPMRDKNPSVPLQPDEIVGEVKRAMSLGITSVHLHARDTSDLPTWKKDVYRRIIIEIRSFAPELIINVSTSGRNWSEFERRADVLTLDGDAKPDVASLTLSSLNFLSGPSINSPDMIRQLASAMLERGIVPELEAFDLGMINMINVLRKEGLLTGTVPLNLLFGNIAGMQPSLSEFAAAVAAIPQQVIWSATGIGDFQNLAQSLAIQAGGGVRVGLEDGMYMDRSRTKLASNLLLLERVHRLLEFAERRWMTPAEFRNLVFAK
jgi:3-keto-5-aminohexanoate cleavage enzyme